MNTWVCPRCEHTEQYSRDYASFERASLKMELHILSTHGDYYDHMKVIQGMSKD